VEEGRGAAGGAAEEMSVGKQKTQPKKKTHKGTAKRFKITAGGKVVRHQAMHSHMLTSKTTKRKRNLRKATVVGTSFTDIIKQLLPS
jgi:large subunit ribosomal protein L35